jgi:ABC-type molybdate transport system substrate-binding protein
MRRLTAVLITLLSVFVLSGCDRGSQVEREKATDLQLVFEATSVEQVRGFQLAQQFKGERMQVAINTLGADGFKCSEQNSSTRGLDDFFVACERYRRSENDVCGRRLLMLFPDWSGELGTLQTMLTRSVKEVSFYCMPIN